MSDLFWLSEAQMRRLAPLLPSDTRGKPRVDDRRVISGIVHVLRSGGRWVDAPAVYGPRKTLYNRFVRWAAKGVWQRVFRALAACGGPPAGLRLDSSQVKAHRRARGGKGGGTRRPSGGWPVARRADQQDPCADRSPRPPDRFRTDSAAMRRWPSPCSRPDRQPGSASPMLPMAAPASAASCWHAAPCR